MASTQLLNQNLSPSPGVSCADGAISARIIVSQTSAPGYVAKYEQDVASGTGDVLQSYADNTGTYYQKFMYIPAWSPTKAYTNYSIVSSGNSLWQAIAPVVGTPPANPAWNLITAPGYTNGGAIFSESQEVIGNNLLTKVHQQGNGANVALGENACLTFETPLTGAAAGSTFIDLMADQGVVIEPEHPIGVAVGGSGQLSIYNKTGSPATSGFWKIFVPGVSGGGLTQSHFHLFSYFGGAGSPFQAITEYMDITPLTAGAVGTPQTGGDVALNWDLLDPARAGTFTGTGAVSPVVVVNSITSTSRVIVSLVGGPAFPAAAPVIAVVSAAAFGARGFTHNAPNGVIYSYIVVG